MEVTEFTDDLFHFNLWSCLNWMERKVRDLFDDHFRMCQEDHLLIYELLVCAIGDQESWT